MNFRYPVVLDVENQPCLVIGGGAGAAERARALLAAGARVTVLGGDLPSGVAGVEHTARDYQTGDLEGFLLAISTAGDRELNGRIWQEACERGTFFNAVDDPEHCRFAFPAIHRQGDLLIAVSSNGKSPVLAARVRDHIAAQFGPEYSELLELLGALRMEIAKRHSDFDTRRRLYARLLDSGALDLIRQGQRERAQLELQSLLECE